MSASQKKEIRVRIAPSPTGPFHLGTARTALFNWLFAKNQGGKFILRVEDTDAERSDRKFEDDIKEHLRWLGLEWDEFYRQSERLDIYEKYLQRLLNEKKAYYCFCSKEELEEERQAQLSQGLPPRYGGRCRRLTAEEVGRRQSKKQPSVIRFAVPETEVAFKDLIRDSVKFNAALFGDLIIAKDLKTPLYNFAAVIDDEEMKISHVIRGEDHLSNTPKQILIQQALGFSSPVYAHLPLILDPDRRKLSKRYAATAVQEYRQAGYLADALVNFLALLGWHPADDREFLSREEIIKEFSLSRVQKAGAAFNQEKLDWLNGQHLRKLNPEEIADLLEPFIKPLGWNKDRGLLIRVVQIERERLKKLADFPATAGFFFQLPDYDKKQLIWQELPSSEIISNIIKLKEVLSNTAAADFVQPKLLLSVEAVVDKSNKGAFLWPLRVALSGQNVSPGPFEIMGALGKNETLRRLEIAIGKLGG